MSSETCETSVGLTGSDFDLLEEALENLVCQQNVQTDEGGEKASKIMDLRQALMHARSMAGLR